MARDLRPITIENAEVFRTNFQGLEEQYNPAGTRHFVIFLPEDVAADLIDREWPVKRLKPREDEEVGRPILDIRVKFGEFRPPAVFVISQGQKQLWTEDMVGMLDGLDLANMDIQLRPFEWRMPNGTSGIKAYLSKAFITLQEDDLDRKYSEIPVAGEQPAPWND